MFMILYRKARRGTRRKWPKGPLPRGKGTMMRAHRLRGGKTIAFVVLCMLALECAASGGGFRFSPRPNRAHLIRWHAWGPEAFDEARRTQKLVVLSLSAVWCHWCHVMDETTYSDEEVIRLINDRFIAVRVDADMRPDIDSRYNQGGWPSTVILTAEGVVVDGANYLPPAEMQEQLRRAAGLSREERERIAVRKEEARKRRAALRGAVTGAPDRDAVDHISGTLKERFDETYGGFGSGQKFPDPDALEFLLAASSRSADPGLRRMVEKTLDRMARGGIYDRVEGGFFRYATKPDWSEPHYEKMLEVNAGLIRTYAIASVALGKKEYQRVVKESAAYVEKNLADPATGAFFGSQDADEAYYRRKDRSGLAKPAVDRTNYADSSSLMVSALAAAYGATGDARYLSRAVKAADFLEANLLSSGEGVRHYFADGAAFLPGVLADNALFGLALLDLADATGDRRYVEKAAAVGRTLMDRFSDREAKRFRPFLAGPGVAHRDDEALTSMTGNLANYRAVRFLARLSQQNRDTKMKEAADAALLSLAGTYRLFPPHAASYGLAALTVLSEPLEITVVAESDRSREYLAAAGSVYEPSRVVRVLSPVRDAEELKKLNYDRGEAVYFCIGKRCSKPVQDPAKVREELVRFLKGSAGM
jgi:uncharacterized protein